MADSGNGGGSATGGSAGGGASGVRQPDITGAIERDGVRTAYASYGSGDTTVVLMPTWSIVPSRFWKGQVPYLARHFRVITFDGRGSGGSDRPVGAAAYSDDEYAADTVAVLDALDVDRAVLVGLSCGVSWSLRVAAAHPDRVSGLFAIAPSCGLGITQPEREQYAFDTRLPTTSGWAKYNKHYWLDGNYDSFLRFFFAKMFSEAHSTKQIEDCLDWGRDIGAARLADATGGRLGCDGALCTPLEPLCEQVRCPITIMHGTDDQVRRQAVGERLAELTGAELILVDGAGHGLPARDPVLVNHAIRRFVEQAHPPQGNVRTVARAGRRRPRALFVSSPIGLGHGLRDVAIADELRKLRPELEIDWLAQHPITRLLEHRDEQVHPASAHLASESGHIESECGEHDLHAFQAIRRMDEILVNNFMVFDDLLTAERYDLVVGDEAWDVDYFLHENPSRKRSAFAWLTDFVGWLPMPAGGPREAELTADYNAEMIEQRARYRRLRDRSIFVGNPDDIVPDSFGPGLPEIRAWTVDNFDFAGYVTGFDPLEVADREGLRARFGYRPDERICLVTVGGSGVGTNLLARVVAAIGPARRQAPDLRFVMVTGPRIDPGAIPATDGLTVHSYLPDLYRHLAATDMAIVQGGLTTCMELAATKRPFLYVPLRNHFEQNFHVRHRLERYRAGRCLPYEQTTDPRHLAAEIVAALDTVPEVRPVETGGAVRAARMLADLI